MSKTNFLQNKNIRIAILILISILLLTPSVYFYSKYRQIQKSIEEPEKQAQEEVKKLVEKVGKLILLPQDEEPTIITITDKEKVKSQPFFAKAENGNKVLVYNQAKKAFLYDPEEDKIIEVGPLILPTQSDVSESTSIKSVSEEEQEKNKLSGTVVILNGTSTVGLTSKIADILSDEAPEIELVSRDNAKSTDYEKTIIVDLTGERINDAEKLADIIQADLSTLPNSETKPENIDFLIIVGQDKK